MPYSTRHPGPYRHPVLRHGVQVFYLIFWIPDQVRDDDSKVRDDDSKVRDDDSKVRDDDSKVRDDDSKVRDFTPAKSGMMIAKSGISHHRDAVRRHGITKRQYVRAKYRLKKMMQSLRLILAPKKTQMGALHKGFHFLCIQFDVARTALSSERDEMPLARLKVRLHPRSILRSIDKIRLKQEEEILLKGNTISSAGQSANVQSQRYRWVKWWARQHGQLRDSLGHIQAWMAMAAR